MTQPKIVRRHLFDWRLVTALIVGLIVVFGVSAGWSGISSGRAKDQNTATALAAVAKYQAQVHELIEQLKGRDAEIQAMAQASQTSTAVFAANQAAMLKFQVAEIAWTRRILNFVRTHPGQPIPASFLVPVPAPRLAAVNARPKAAKHHGKAKPKG